MISCEPSNYTLIIAEKLKAAKKIAEALSDNPLLCKKYGIPYWLVKINGRFYIVASASGHLFTLVGDSKFPVFDAEWKPIWIERKSKRLKRIYDLLKYLAGHATEFINACDYDIEGSLIGYLIIKFFGDLSKAKRMKFSALTKADILQSFRNLSSLDYNMIEAGIARHKIDWLWGINISRALMLAVKEVAKRRIILSAGRVQSPTLINIVKLEKDRGTFIPLPIYSIVIFIKIKDLLLKINFNKKFEYINDTIKFKNYLKGKKIIVSEVKNEVINLERPPPFNLGDLQIEAGRIYGYSPYKVEKIAEELYLEGLISYPRTNSQQIPSSINIYEIVNNLYNSIFNKYINILDKITNKKYIIKQGKKTDLAHPAIHPTGLLPSRKLSKDEYKIYELIVRRFLASISRDATIVKQTIVFKIENFENDKINYILQKIENPAWLLLYPYSKVKQNEIPNLKLSNGDEGLIVDIKILQNYTKPPKRYTKISLLKWMENVEIGTEATRAQIIETLFTRKYVTNFGKYIIPTDLGLAITEVLEEFFSEITSVEMTSDLEKKLNEVKLGKLKGDHFVLNSLNKLKSYILKFYYNKEKIGEKLSKVLKFINYKKCELCNFEVYKDELCKYHYIALSKLNDAIHEWRIRSNENDSIRILYRLLSNKYTGKLIKDIIKSYFLNDESHAKG